MRYRLYLLALIILSATSLKAQVCTGITATYSVTESRCVATGSIEVFPSGGSGNFEYKVSGPIITNYSSSNLITGLSAGKYLVTIHDINANCIYAHDTVTVAGSYATPSFIMTATASTCANTPDGSIVLTSQQFGRAPFSYKIIAPSASAVGTVSSTGNFSGLIAGDYLIQLSDSCGALQTRAVTVPTFTWKINNLFVTKVCDTLFVTIQLKDGNGNLSPNSVFNGFVYGVLRAPGDTAWFSGDTFQYTLNHQRSLTFVVRDLCGATDKQVWIETAIPALATAVITGNIACSTFTAFVTGAINLSASTQYCLYNSSNIQLSCNSTGLFNNIPFGSYCIKAIDNCYDTIITRCFAVARPIPFVDPLLQTFTSCFAGTAIVTGQLNLNNPNYCLYNNSNVLISCNSNGVFANIPFGSYCIRIQNDPACYDTIITRCFIITAPAPAATISAVTCNSFTASVVNTANLSNAQFCLYDASNVQLSCNTTGVFTGLPFGSYCITAVNDPFCFDTTFTVCFTQLAVLPAVGNVNINNQTCAGFTATVNGQAGLSNPQFCLYNSLNVLQQCNTTGVFSGIPYGSYCIKVQNDPACHDTIITRCFTVLNNLDSVRFTLSSAPTCTPLGSASISVDITSGNAPFFISVYAPSGTLVASGAPNGGGHTFTFPSVPGLPGSLPYSVVVSDQCGVTDTVNIVPNISVLQRVKTIKPKCPTGSLPNGGADVIFDVSNNNIGGNIKPRIIKKDGVNTTINSSSNVSYVYTFANLAPGTYIFATRISNCSNTDVFDTLTVLAYASPDLLKSAAYTCDNGSISIGAAVTGGVGPFSYEIIGSTPAAPSVNAGPQSNPVFNINNGTQYSLIRLRAVDACGNAALNDVGILPLGTVGVSAGFDCFYVGLTLKADSVPNTTYKWYHKLSATDSVLVSNSSTYTMPYLMPPDTGRYVCVISVNNGCLTRYAFYNVVGNCAGGILPVSATLTADMNNDGSTQLSWQAYNEALNLEYDIQRSENAGSDFETIGTTNTHLSGDHHYSFTDPVSVAGNSYYRLKMVSVAGDISYSNVVLVRNNHELISAAPNPVRDQVNIIINNNSAADYRISISDLGGREIYSSVQRNFRSGKLLYRRTNAAPGIYVISVMNLRSGQRYSEKLLFL